ncbi:hypothetical protein BGX26_007847 [Mortierella sp. AD094]|nr:hypothetical protein BGX26_007847 [Mortierella sp. AD094]
MLILRHSHLSSEDLITCERALLRFVSGRAKTVDLDFNVWDYTVPEIYGYILGMFVKLDLVECLGITTGELLDFIVDVDRGYLATFYHSFYHAADVTSVLYHMLQGMRASQYLCKADMASLLLAGLCHDIGHPGLNNLFQINAKTELLNEYGEASVLEKYSCSLAMDLVTKHSLFRNISKSPTAMLPEGLPATEDTMRESMVKAILATDMAFHYDMLNNLNNLFEATTSPVSSSDSEADTDSEPECDGLETSTTTQPRVHIETTQDLNVDQSKQMSISISSPLSKLQETLRTKVEAHRQCRRNSCSSIHSQSSGESEILASPQSIESLSISPADLTPEQRQNLCNCLLHAADISNAVKPWTVCKRWSDLVVQEFFRQGDIEKAQGLPVSPNMDRDQQNQSKISLGFGDFVVQPYFEALVELLPEASPVLTSLANNRTQWVALQKSSNEFGNDPYLSIDPLEDPSLARRPSYSEFEHMPSGRRVSVAAGVLILDDTKLLRTPHRRLRHSTNTEITPGHALRRIKRSFSGRSLSTSMQNLHAHNPRSSQSSGRPASGQGILISALKRQASMTEREMSSTSLHVHYGQYSGRPDESGDSYFATQPPPPPPKPTQSFEPTTPKIVDQQKHKSIGSGDSGSGGAGGGVFRQKRLASLQVGSPTPSNFRQEYGDGYVMPKNQSATTENIPNSRDSPSPASSSPKPLHQGQATPTSTQAGNRSSTPAVMMSKIKYDWALSPTLAEIPSESRFGCGPLDDGENTTTVLNSSTTSPDPATSSSPSLTTVATRIVGVDPVELSTSALISKEVDTVDPVLGGSTPSPAESVSARAIQATDGAVLISTAESPIDRKALFTDQ